MIASTPGLAECEKRFNTLPPSAGIKSMWLKTHTCVFSSTNRQQQDGPGSSSCAHNHEHKLSNSMCLAILSCSVLLCTALRCSVLRCAPMIFSTPGLAECEKRLNTLPPNVGIKSMWLKTHTASNCSVPTAPPAPGRGAAGPNQSPTSRCHVAYSDTPSRALHAPTKYAPAHVAVPTTSATRCLHLIVPI